MFLYIRQWLLKVMQIMKKGLCSLLAAVLLALVVAVTPAFAAGMNANEQKAYDEFCAILDKYAVSNGGWFDAYHNKQYKEEARSALLHQHIDLDQTAYQEFSDILKKIDPILAKCHSEREAWSHYDEIVKLVNSVANKYDMDVYVTSSDHNAHVVVKQTGYGLVQTGIVAGASAAVLCVAFFISKKFKLFL